MADIEKLKAVANDYFKSNRFKNEYGVSIHDVLRVLSQEQREKEAASELKLSKKELMLLDKKGTVLRAVDKNGRGILFDYAYMTLHDEAIHFKKDFMHIENKAPIGFDKQKRIACYYDECIYLEVVSGEEAKKFREAVAWIKKECPKEDKTPESRLIDIIDQQQEHKSETAVDDSKCYVMFRNEEKQLRPFVTKVLVCDEPGTYWRPAIFGCKTALDTRHYVMVGGASYTYCIPYHDNRQHVGNEFNINYYKQ